MSWPEEDLDQGGLFLLQRERFIIFLLSISFENNSKTLSPQQKTTTLVKILFRAAHTYSKDSKKRCLVNWS